MHSDARFACVCAAYADAGTAPIDFPLAPTLALPKALQSANLTKDDISLFEINEAFSVVVRAAEKVLGLDPAKVNVNGYAGFLFFSFSRMILYADVILVR